MQRYNYYFITLISFLFITSCSSDKEDIIEPETPTKTVILTIKTPNDSDIDFGNIVKAKSKTIEINIHNDGNSKLTISKIELPDGYDGDWTSSEIAKNSSKSLIITFLPTNEIEYSGTITITSNATNKPKATNITGTGISDIYDGDILLKTQEELNDFIDKGFTSITGKLSLGSNGPNFDATNLTNILPLQNIKEVERLAIFNSSLVNLNGLENVIIKGGIITIGLNNSLTSLDGFPTSNSFSLINILQNPSLTNVDALTNVTKLGTLSINENINLENLNGLSNLNTIDYSLNIGYNSKIKNLDAFSNLTKIGGTITVRFNEQLNSFCGIRPLLSSGGLNGTFYLMRYNRYNPSKSEIINGQCQRDIPDNVYHGEMRISDQSDLDYFAEKKYEKIEGRLIILIGINDTHRKITDLTGLTNLKEITQSLSIVRTQVANLNGINNLTKIGTYFEITGNNQLSDFCAIVPLAQTTNGFGSLTLNTNLFNPTLEDLKSGNCSQ